MVVSPDRFSGPFITETFFQEFKDPGYINMGRCYDWAYYAYCLFPDVNLWTSDYHAWVEYKERFYDSEASVGVIEYTALPCNSRCGWDEVEPHEVHNIEVYKELWDRIGAGRRHHWNTMIKEILTKGLTPVRH